MQMNDSNVAKIRGRMEGGWREDGWMMEGGR